MSVPDANAPEEIAWAGDWIVAKRRGRWEYASRARNIHAAVIVPLDGPAEARDVILVDQYRVPVGCRVLELPAGLIGDLAGSEGEDPLLAAKRELEEETGYRARQWDDLGTFWSSPGMVSERFTLLRATGLEQVGPGGGDEHEDINVHRVPVADIAGFVADARARGMEVDVKLLLVLGAHIMGIGQ